jgi:hypothetical protein
VLENTSSHPIFIFKREDKLYGYILKKRVSSLLKSKYEEKE